MIGLTWPHISDRLQKGEKEFGNFIIFSRNISCSGKAEEYDIVTGDLLGSLPKACDAGQNRLFMAPSSHDIDLDVFKKFPSEVKKSPGSGERAHRKM